MICSHAHRNSGAIGLLFGVMMIVVEEGTLTAGRRFRESSQDFELTRAMGQGDQDAARSLYDRYSCAVFRYIYRRIGERTEDAEDLTLETFLAAIELARKFDGKSGVYAWLCGIAKLKLIEFHRREVAAKRASVQRLISLSDERFAEILTDGHAGHCWLDHMTARELIDMALKGLSHDELEIVTLRIVEGHSSRDAAKLVKRSERAVESILLRARRKLRRSLVDLVSPMESGQ